MILRDWALGAGLAIVAMLGIAFVGLGPAPHGIAGEFGVGQAAPQPVPPPTPFPAPAKAPAPKTDAAAAPAPPAPPVLPAPSNLTPAAYTPIDPAQLEAFVDGLIGGYMRDAKINGATVAVVRGNATLLTKGYGADRTDGRRVAPDRTLFRIASISKTFTWVALLQLIETGKVDLNAPVNDYLPDSAKVADFGFAAPVRVRHLFSHNAGFEDAFAGRLFRADMANALAMAQEVGVRPPARVRPPGVAAVYSNYGSVLAGLIVQTVSGQAFQTWVEEKIFNPLGMTRTTFREPYPAKEGQPAPINKDLAGDISQGFSWRAGRAMERPFEYVTPNAPAGGASTTAADMARYMRMFLNNGALDGAQILSPATIAKLSGEPLFANAPGVNGLAYGFMQTRSRKGWRAYGHGGNTLWFASWMAIYPELDFAVFVIGNTEGASRKLQADLPRAIVDQFFPAPEGFSPPPAPDPAAAPALARFAGEYLTDRRNFTTSERAFCLVGCSLLISAAPEGQILASSVGETARLTPLDVVTEGQTAYHRFRNVETGETSAFIVEPGLPVRFAAASGVLRASQIDWTQSPATFYQVLQFSALAGLMALLSGVWRAFRRRREGSETRAVGVLLPLAGAAWLGTVASLALAAAPFAADAWQVFAAWPPALLPVAQWGSLVATGLTVVATALTLLGWREADWSFWRRARLVLTLAALTAAPFALAQWNLLGPR
jgi:CubicO group peptidase (beta-lactamase class C family)